MKPSFPPPINTPVAILFSDNWDGQHDRCHCIATWDGKDWTTEPSMRRKPEYEGDEVIAWWALELDPEPCKWTFDEEHDCWETDCRNAFCFSEDGKPKRDGLDFCPYCGKPIEVTETIAAV